MAKGFLASAAMALALSVSAPAQAANYALVIGIDDYETQPDLGGALNDARLIATALQEFGVSELRVLLDGDASYDAISSAWQDLLARAQPGDTIILTYSGHGARTPDTNGDEASLSQPDDVTDEMLVLPGFDPQSPAGLREKIVDDELHQWFLAAGAKDVQVVFVADSCFSGTLTRGGRARFLKNLLGFEDEVERKPLKALAETEEETIENVVFLAGSREAEPVIEVAIGGRYHGALSYAFARALSMDADLDGDGVLGRNDLETFIPRTAKSFNGSRYLPEINPSDGPDFDVLTPDKSTPVSDEVPSWSIDENGDDVTASFDPNRVPLAAQPGSYWDRETGNVHDATGEIVGYDIAENRLYEVDDKFSVLNLVREGMIRNGTTVSTLRNGRPWHRELTDGQEFAVEVGPLTGRYLTVFNLANNGEVQAVFPFEPSQRGPLRVGEVLSFDAVAAEPYGADELIAIITDHEPVDLRQALRWAMPAGEFIPILTRILGEGGATFGHISIFTKRG